MNLRDEFYMKALLSIFVFFKFDNVVLTKNTIRQLCILNLSLTTDIDQIPL